MVIIDGTCVICAKYKSVLSLGDKHTYLDILKTNLFPEELNRFRKFSKLFTENPNSICVACAYKIDLYNQSKSNWPTNKKYKKICVLCSNDESDSIFKCLSELKNDIAQFTNNKITGAPNICLNCSFCLDGWNDIKNWINQLLNASSSEELNSTTVSSSTSNLTMEKRRHSVANEASIPLKKLKKSENANNKKVKHIRGKFQNPSKEKNRLDKKLQHLVTVDNETIDRNMNLSFSVLTDQKMMFEIPYIACDSIPSESTIDAKSSEKMVSDDDTKNNEKSTDSGSSVEFVSSRSIKKRSRRLILSPARPKSKRMPSESSADSKSLKNKDSDDDKKNNEKSADSDSSVQFVSSRSIKKRSQRLAPRPKSKLNLSESTTDGSTPEKKVSADDEKSNGKSADSDASIENVSTKILRKKSKKADPSRPKRKQKLSESTIDTTSQKKVSDDDKKNNEKSADSDSSMEGVFNRMKSRSQRAVPSPPGPKSKQKLSESTIVTTPQKKVSDDDKKSNEKSEDSDSSVEGVFNRIIKRSKRAVPSPAGPKSKKKLSESTIDTTPEFKKVSDDDKKDNEKSTDSNSSMEGVFNRMIKRSKRTISSPARPKSKRKLSESATDATSEKKVSDDDKKNNEKSADSDSSVEDVSTKKNKSQKAVPSPARPKSKRKLAESITDTTPEKKVSDDDKKNNEKSTDSDSSVEDVSTKMMKNKSQKAVPSPARPKSKRKLVESITDTTPEKKVSDDDKKNNEKSTDSDSSVEIVSSRIMNKRSQRVVPSPARPKSKRKLPKERTVVSSNCSKCNKTLKKKYILTLHELEHENSFSPSIVIEQQDLQKILNEYKAKNNSVSQENLEICDKEEEASMEITNNDTTQEEKESAETIDKDATQEKDESVDKKDTTHEEEKSVETKDKDATPDEEESLDKKDISTDEEEKPIEDATQEEAESVDTKDDESKTETDNVLSENNLETKEKDDESVDKEGESVNKEDEVKKIGEISDEEDKDTSEDQDNTETIQDKEEEEAVSDPLADIDDKTDQPEEDDNKDKEESDNEGKESEENENETENREKSEEIEEKKSDTDDDCPEEKKSDTDDDCPEEKKSDPDGDCPEEKTNDTDNDENADAPDDKENDPAEDKEIEDEAEATEDLDKTDTTLHADELEDISSEDGIERNGIDEADTPEPVENGHSIEDEQNDEERKSNGRAIEDTESESSLSLNTIPAGEEESESEMGPLKISSGDNSPEKKWASDDDILKESVLASTQIIELDKKSKQKLPDSDRFKIMENILNKLGA